jgi:hypothetical protein
MLFIMPAQSAIKESTILGSLVPYPEFARRVKEITGEVSTRVASIHGGISHDTIARMWRGERVSEGMVLRFAAGYKTDPNPLLIALGYPPIPNSDKGAETKAKYEIAIPEIERIPDEEHILHLYRGIADKETARRFLEIMSSAVEVRGDEPEEELSAGPYKKDANN